MEETVMKSKECAPLFMIEERKIEAKHKMISFADNTVWRRT